MPWVPEPVMSFHYFFLNLDTYKLTKLCEMCLFEKFVKIVSSIYLHH